MHDVTIDISGNLFLADYNNGIRKVELSPPFPVTEVKQSSSVQNLYLQINQTLTISGIAVPAAEGSNSSEFPLGSITGCALGTELAAGSVCTIPITFTPAYPGNRGTPLVVTYTPQGGGTPLHAGFILTATGKGPQVEVVKVYLCLADGQKR